MRWYFQLRAAQPERAPSRVLQVLETQRVLPRRFEAWQCHDAMHVRFLLDGDDAQAYRIGWLLRRLAAITSAYWLAIRDDEEEKVLWQSTALASKAEVETDVDLDPDSGWWRGAPSVTMLGDNNGLRVAAHETEVRIRWTNGSLYFLFDCGYERLSVFGGEPMMLAPTPKLWEHDVAEVFVGVNRDIFREYQEFEVSPRGEWIDFNITSVDGAVLAREAAETGFLCAARIDRDRQRWVAFLRIPMAQAGDLRGGELRLNLFRSQGPRPVEVAWQATHQESFHVPASFGYLRLVG